MTEEEKEQQLEVLKKEFNRSVIYDLGFNGTENKIIFMDWDHDYTKVVKQKKIEVVASVDLSTTYSSFALEELPREVFGVVTDSYAECEEEGFDIKLVDFNFTVTSLRPIAEGLCTFTWVYIAK